MKKVVLSLIIILSICMITGCKSNEKKIKNNEILYDMAVNYIISNDDSEDRGKERYNMFADYIRFETTKDNKYRYAYMWITTESYYVADNKIVSTTGNSMPYKFTFEMKKDKVVKYETPEDGNKYVKSIKKMFPDNIENKVINYKYSSDKIIRDVKDFYKDISDQDIYTYTGEEYIKLNK